MTRDQEIALCEKLKKKAALYASNPAKGHADGYRPRHTTIPNPDRYPGLDRPADIPGRTPYTAWLHGVVEKDLAHLRGRWVIEEGEGPEDTLLVLT